MKTPKTPKGKLVTIAVWTDNEPDREKSEAVFTDYWRSKRALSVRLFNRTIKVDGIRIEARIATVRTFPNRPQRFGVAVG